MYESCIEIILDQTEATMREAILSIPDGRYEFTDHLDDYGPDTEPLTSPGDGDRRRRFAVR